MAFLLIVPGLFLLYGGLAAAIGGVGIICAFALIQLPLFFILKRLKMMPAFTLGLPPTRENSAVHELSGADSDAENNLIQRP